METGKPSLAQLRKILERIEGDGLSDSDLRSIHGAKQDPDLLTIIHDLCPVLRPEEAACLGPANASVIKAREVLFTPAALGESLPRTVPRAMPGAFSVWWHQNVLCHRMALEGEDELTSQFTRAHTAGSRALRRLDSRSCFTLTSLHSLTLAACLVDDRTGAAVLPSKGIKLGPVKDLPGEVVEHSRLRDTAALFFVLLISNDLRTLSETCVPGPAAVELQSASKTILESSASLRAALVQAQESTALPPLSQPPVPRPDPSKDMSPSEPLTSHSEETDGNGTFDADIFSDTLPAGFSSREGHGDATFGADIFSDTLPGLPRSRDNPGEASKPPTRSRKRGPTHSLDESVDPGPFAPLRRGHKRARVRTPAQLQRPSHKHSGAASDGWARHRGSPRARTTGVEPFGPFEERFTTSQLSGSGSAQTHIVPHAESPGRRVESPVDALDRGVQSTDHAGMVGEEAMEFVEESSEEGDDDCPDSCAVPALRTTDSLDTCQPTRDDRMIVKYRVEKRLKWHVVARHVRLQKGAMVKASAVRSYFTGAVDRFNAWVDLNYYRDMVSADKVTPDELDRMLSTGIENREVRARLIRWSLLREGGDPARVMGSTKGAKGSKQRASAAPPATPRPSASSAGSTYQGMLAASHETSGAGSLRTPARLDMMPTHMDRLIIAYRVKSQKTWFEVARLIRLDPRSPHNMRIATGDDLKLIYEAACERFRMWKDFHFYMPLVKEGRLQLTEFGEPGDIREDPKLAAELVRWSEMDTNET